GADKTHLARGGRSPSRRRTRPWIRSVRSWRRRLLPLAQHANACHLVRRASRPALNAIALGGCSCDTSLAGLASNRRSSWIASAKGVLMTTTTSESAPTGTGQVERKPLMTGRALLMMNLGFFGVQFSFGLTQSAVNPLFLLIGADPDQLPILNLAGPVTGLVIQPLIGAVSDRTWHPRWGRRRPFITAGALLCAIILFVFPFVGVLWLAVICFWLLDAGNNT